MSCLPRAAMRNGVAGSPISCGPLYPLVLAHLAQRLGEMRWLGQKKSLACREGPWARHAGSAHTGQPRPFRLCARFETPDPVNPILP